MPTSSFTLQHVLNNNSLYLKPKLERDTLESILGKGLLTTEGETHKRQRKVLNPAFAMSYVRDIVPIFSEKANELVDCVFEQLKAQTAEGVEMFRLLSCATFDIIGSAGLCVVSRLT